MRNDTGYLIGELNYVVFLKETLQVNVEKVLERDQKLSQLDDRADALQVCLLKCVSLSEKGRRRSEIASDFLSCYSYYSLIWFNIALFWHLLAFPL